MTTTTSVPNSRIARAAARRLWQIYGFDDIRDLHLEDLALAEGVLVVESPLESADAWLVRNDRRGIIRIRASIPEPGRKRFAIAHELGHWFLHGHVSQLFACTSEDLAARYRGSPIEIEANLFASELLMPTELFSSRTQQSPPTIRCLEQLSAEFQTSFTATAIRYIDCASTPCAVVCSREGLVRWWMASRPFADHCGSSGGKHLYSLPGANSAPVVELPLTSLRATWNAHTALHNLTEEVLPMPEYNQQIHLVWSDR